ncbi:asparagine synthase-related protein [Aurantiacibacter hainanensis]|uniref:asparagine synthase-related protein n=1 Tax=Aurantiacibacter hainanensis TaxID=3076114 RepID=UPI0030C674F0
MSGICGVLTLDGRPVDKAEMARLIAPLKVRGPEGQASWTSGSVGLGHTLLATTPEAENERLPLVHGPTGCAITADCRLDNRKELFALLGLGADAASMGDGELVLRLYCELGLVFLEHLVGDFAFALWDPRQRRLVCARDPMGMRQLLYTHRESKAFVFASEARAVLAHGLADRTIDMGRVADYLEDLEAYDLTSTFFHEVKRLAPGQVLLVDDRGLVSRPYWQLPDVPLLHCSSDAEYAEAFLEVFTKAVGARLRHSGKLGSMLSGGVDSGSVSAVASQLLLATGGDPLPTFSAVSAKASPCAETRAIRAASTMPGIVPSYVAYEMLGQFQRDLERLTDASQEPFDGNMTLVRAVYCLAKAKGAKIVLDGVAGDTTLPFHDPLPHYFARLQLSSAWREAKGREAFWGGAYPALETFMRSAYRAYVPEPLRRIRHAIANDTMPPNGRSSCVAIELAERVNLADRRAQFRRTIDPKTWDLTQRQFALVHPYAVVARERYDRVASALGIEPRDPFRDLRLVRFCLSLPPGQIEAGGWPKIILRRAMKGLLPDRVAWRRGKEHLGSAFTQALFSHRKLPWGSDPNWGLRLDGLVRSQCLGPTEGDLPKAEDIDGVIRAHHLASWLALH